MAIFKDKAIQPIQKLRYLPGSFKESKKMEFLDSMVYSLRSITLDEGCISFREAV